MTPAYQIRAEIVRKEQPTGDICRFTLGAPDIAPVAGPGQFVMIKTAAGYDPLLRRPFSIHQITAAGTIQILFKVIGKGTRLLAALNQGQQVDLIGPLGKGFDIGGQRPVFLLGGGIGAAPLLFLAQRLLQQDNPPPLQVFLGAHSREEVAALAEDFASMGLTAAIATDDGSLGHHGFVTDFLDDLPPGGAGMLYACGPYPMMRQAAGVCREKDLRCQVSMETFMACGLAACLGCAIPKKNGSGYVHCCKDGPVFYADDIAWL
jgi:dihydroorotate dehydrogenase electron transfer subunit